MPAPLPARRSLARSIADRLRDSVREPDPWAGLVPRSIRLGFCLVLVGGSIGCDITTTGPVRTDLKASDDVRLHPGGRAEVAILPRNGRPRQGIFDLAADAPAEADPSVPIERSTEIGESVADRTTIEEPVPSALNLPPAPRRRRDVQPTLAVELEYRAGWGKDDGEVLDGAHFVDYDGRTIVGPESLNNAFTLHLATANVRGGARFFDMISVEGLGGISTSALHFVVRTPTTRTGDTSVGVGANIGGRITITPHPVVDFYAQAQIHMLDGLQSGHDRIVIPTLEAGSNLHVTRNVSLFGGWRTWAYAEKIEDRSDIDDLDVSGPTFGLFLRF